jgi:hypothetical protein
MKIYMHSDLFYEQMKDIPGFMLPMLLVKR